MKKSHISIGAVILIVVLILLVRVLSRSGPSGPAATTGSGSSAGYQTSATARPRTSGQAQSAGAPNSGGGVTYDPSLAQYLPNPKLTPGDVLDVTAKDFCVSGYSKNVRDVPQSVKDEAYSEYGITSHRPGQYEVDHLISLELGGSNSIRNLWPESYTGQWNAHIKDELENKLHDLVCSGQLDMKTAQQAIATNWIAAYQKYVNRQP